MRLFRDAIHFSFLFFNYYYYLFFSFGFVVGSPGGSRIIPYVAKTIIAHLDWGLDPQAAVALPHLVNRFGTFDIEEGTEAETLADPLADLGFEVNARALTSGLHAIAVGEVLTGGADPRREGIALGE